MKRLILLSMAVLFFCGWISVGYAQEKGYPNKPIQILIPYSAGGAIDLYIRLLSSELTKTWGTPINIINKSGGGGAVAPAEVASAEKDGYTLLGANLAQIAILTAANPNGPFNLVRDLDAVQVSAYSGQCIFTKVDSKFKSFEDIIEYGRKKPGEPLCGTGSIGSSAYLEVLLLNRLAKISMTLFPLPGTSDVIPSVLGGHMELGCTSDVTVKPHVDSGKMRVLVTDYRSLFPNVTTFAEKGYPQINLQPAIGLLMPKGVSPSIIKIWEDSLTKIVKDQKFVESYHKLGYRIKMTTGKQRLDQLLKEEVAKYSHFTPEELGWKK